MYRVLYLVSSGLLLLTTSSPVLAQQKYGPYTVPQEGPANPVFVANPPDDYSAMLAGLIGIGIVIALLLAMLWVQLSGIRAAIEKQGGAPKT